MADTTENMDGAEKLREVIQAQLGSQIMCLCEAHAQIAVLTEQLKAVTAERDALQQKAKPSAD